MSSQEEDAPADLCQTGRVRAFARLSRRVVMRILAWRAIRQKAPTRPTDEEGKMQTRIDGTTVPALEALKAWLIQQGCTSVAMESTGSYWIPVKNVLEGNMEIVLDGENGRSDGGNHDVAYLGRSGRLHRHNGHGRLCTRWIGCFGRCCAVAGRAGPIART